VNRFTKDAAANRRIFAFAKAAGIPILSADPDPDSFPSLDDLVQSSVRIVEPDHVSSLPVRVANFLRLHDHLHEVRRMTEASEVLTKRVQEMELQLNLIMKGSTP
jgi:hypothetical protein